MLINPIRDPQRGDGHAIIHLSQAELPAEASGLSFTLLKAGQKSLSQKGEWVIGECNLTPDETKATSQGLELAVGPVVVDNVDPHENYKFRLNLPDGSHLSGIVAWPMIPPSNVSAPPPLSPEPSQPPVAPQGSASEPGVAEAEMRDESEAAAVEQSVGSTAKPSPKNNSKFFLAAALICLLLAVAGVTWYFLHNPAESGPSQEPAAPRATADKPAPQETWGQGPAKAGSAPVTLENRLQEAFRSKAAPAVIYDLAKQLTQKPGGAEPAYMALWKLADEGYDPAAMLVASYNDPTEQMDRGDLPTNAGLAYQYYQKALQNGQNEAGQRLTRLKQWVEQQAQQGDAKAKMLLRTWQ